MRIMYHEIDCQYQNIIMDRCDVCEAILIAFQRGDAVGYQRGREDALIEVDQQNFIIDEGQPYAEAWRYGYRQGREDAALSAKKAAEEYCDCFSECDCHPASAANAVYAAARGENK